MASPTVAPPLSRVSHQSKVNQENDIGYTVVAYEQIRYWFLPQLMYTNAQAGRIRRTPHLATREVNPPYANAIPERGTPLVEELPL
jgi:hypothetical protein